MGDKILRNLRESRKLTQANMASILEIERSTYTKYESGKSKPDSIMLNKIADYFDVSIDYLLGRTSIPNLQRLKNKEKSCHNIDVSGLSDEAIRQVEDYVEFVKQKYNSDKSIKNK